MTARGSDRSMEYKKGLRVRHPLVPDWGIGEVLEDSTGGTVRVFFVNQGEKKLSLEGLELLKVQGKEGHHPILDNLRITTEEGLRFRSLAQSIQGFLKEFPAGFYGEKFAQHERDYKLKAHQQMQDLLGKNEMELLRTNGDYEEICQRAIRLVSGTNLIHLHEKLALRNALTSPQTKQRFSAMLRTHLFGDADLKTRFVEFCDLLDELNAGKWTIATYFLFFMFPDRHMFIKPTITKNSADICAFDIHYRPDLNWTTYDAVLRFSQFLRDELRDLKPRDMIDVQSFMWCIRTDTTSTTKGRRRLGELRVQNSC